MFEIILYSTKYRKEVSFLVEQFFDQTLNEFGLKMDQTIEHIEKDLTTFLLVSNNKIIGIIAGSISLQIMSNKKIFQEIIWYVDKDHRGQGIRLLQYLEKWCLENDISKIIMVCMHNSMPDNLHDFYKRMGYKPMETHFIKDVQNAKIC